MVHTTSVACLLLLVDKRDDFMVSSTHLNDQAMALEVSFRIITAVCTEFIGN